MRPHRYLGLSWFIRVVPLSRLAVGSVKRPLPLNLGLRGVRHFTTSHFKEVRPDCESSPRLSSSIPFASIDPEAPPVRKSIANEILTEERLIDNQASRGYAQWLRDACNCELCVDRSTTQKLFETKEIPSNIEISKRRILPDGAMEITWHKDIPRYGDNHVSIYHREFLDRYGCPFHRDESTSKYDHRIPWDRERIIKNIKFIDFGDYMSSDLVLYDALKQLRAYGLLFIRGVPDSAAAVEDIGGRIGNLKHTFYGLTWDVKSVPNPINIAYTDKALGFHMDMLYLSNPPSLQLLHCLRNSCRGGASLFSDSLLAAYAVQDRDLQKFRALTENHVTFHYENAGHNYERVRLIVELFLDGSICRVNWSPSFQAPFYILKGLNDRAGLSRFGTVFEALKQLASDIENPQNVYEHRLKEGECVIFNNERILHARRAFDARSGERWLKGAYLDADVWHYRYSRLDESMG